MFGDVEMEYHVLNIPLTRTWRNLSVAVFSDPSVILVFARAFRRSHTSNER